MPFFPAIKNKNRNSKNVTLQVQVPLNKIVSRGKRVLSSVPYFQPGSLTIEAALGLSIFIFAVVTLMIPMKVMDTRRQVQASLEAVGEDIGQFAYIQYKLDRGDSEAIKGTSWKSEFAQYFIGAAAESYAGYRVGESIHTNAVSQISMARSSVLGDGETIDLICTYQVKLPFPILRMDSISQTSRCFRRAWIGKDGGRGETGGDGEEDEDEIVYVGKSGTRYHRVRTCHYLYNHISTVDYGDLASLRNDSGSRYQPCDVCAGNVKSGPVFIMPSGGSYHGSRNCSAITAYVRAVPLSVVDHLGPCSYCSQ